MIKMLLMSAAFTLCLTMIVSCGQNDPETPDSIIFELPG